MRSLSIILIGLLFIGFGFSTVYAHTSEQVDPYEIEIGWEDEPPVAGLPNFITFEITESRSEGVKSGVTNAFKDLQVTIKFGGVSKVLDINSDPRPGHYNSKIIPTKTGSFVLEFDGEINGVPVDIVLHPEAVENTAVLDFPPRQAASNEEVGALKNALSSLQKDITDLKSSSVKTDAVTENGNTYNFAVFGLSLGAAGVILAIIAMIKRK